MYLLVMKAEAD